MAAALAAGVQGITPYLAQEYVAGEALDAALRQFGPPPAGETLTTLRRVADALDRAAGEGIHHGTLHPRDILIAEGGDARVIDLGVGQALMRSGLRVPVRRPYSAPERVADLAWNGAADIYSLGAIAYELITGRRVSGPGRPDVQAPGLTPAAADRLSELLGRALAEDPAERYPSAADLVDALAPWLPTGRRSTRKKTKSNGGMPLPLEVGEPTIAMTPATPAPSELPPAELPSVELRPAAPPEVDADFPMSDQAPAPRFTSLDDEPEPVGAVNPIGLDEGERAVLRDSADGDDAGAISNWPTSSPVPQRAAPMLRGPFLPLVMALVVGVAAGFGWGYWTAFRTISREARVAASDAALSPGTAPSQSVRVDEPEVIGERNLPSPAATPQARATPVDRTPTPAPPAARTAPAPPATRPAPAARPAPALPPGRLVVRSAPTGSQVRVDGRVRGRTPLVLRDMPLRVVRVTVERGGFTPDDRRVALSAAQPTVTVDARLTPLAPPAPVATTGALVIESRPTGATVFVDGRRVGTTPMSLPESAPGTYRIRLEMAGFSPWVTTADVQAGARIRVAASLERGTPE